MEKELKDLMLMIGLSETMDQSIMTKVFIGMVRCCGRKMVIY